MRSRFSSKSNTTNAAPATISRPSISSKSSARVSATSGIANTAASYSSRSSNGAVSSTNLGVKPSIGHTGRAPQARNEANSSTSGEMREMADFLKNSAPPPGVTSFAVASRAEMTLKEEERGFKGMFRRKKAFA